MNEIANKFLLVGDKFMPEMNLKQAGFTYSVFGPFTKNKKRISKFKEKGDTKYIYRKELDKTCFQHDMPYGDFQDLARRTASDEVLKDKAFNIVKNPRYDGCQRVHASMAYYYFDKKTSCSGANNDIKQNQQLTENLHKPIIKVLKKKSLFFI